MDGFEERNAKLNKLKYIFTFFNGIVLVVSLFLIGFTIFHYLEERSFAVIKESIHLEYSAILLFLITFTTFITVIYGFFSVILIDKSFLIIYSITTFMVGVISIGNALSCGGYLSNISEQNLLNTINHSLKTKYGRPKENEVTFAWDTMQSQYECCGAASDYDYIQSSWFRKQIAFPRRRRPTSCCPSCESLFSQHCINKNLPITEICTAVVYYCGINSTHPLDSELCFGNFPIPEELPIGMVIHKKACIDVIYSESRSRSKKFILVSIIFAVLAIANSIFVLFIHQQVFVSASYHTIAFTDTASRISSTRR